MAFTKITNAELNSRGATTLPNVPTIGATALKQEFDAPAKNIVAPKVNNLIDELQASTAAADLGAVAPTGRTGTSVQSVLNSLSSDLGTAEAQSHAHPNKAVIDKFADDGTGLTYDGNPVGAVTSVNGQTGAVVLTASDVGALPSTTAIPTKTSDLTNDSGFITSGDIPTIPTKTSDLTNDSNFVADASYVHTDNNYDATAKAIVDGATAAIAAKSTVAWNQIDTTGTKIAEIIIDGVKTDVKATGGGGSADAYKTIDAGGQSFVASGADTFKINSGSNVTITPLTGDKGIQISAAGGGTSTGDMLMNDYDRSGDVKSASSSGNGIKDYVASAISGKADASLLKSTVGWTGKNLLENTSPSRTVNGVTATVNVDGSITLNGTHTASASDIQVRTHVEDIIANGMIISGVPSGASNVKLRISLNQSPWTEFAVDTGSGATISGYSSQTNVNCNLTLVGNGTVYNNVTIYPMLRKASVIDPTYEPYHENVEEYVPEVAEEKANLFTKNAVGWSGKNLLDPVVLAYAGQTRTINGITLTYIDGVVNINGTATADTDFAILAKEKINELRFLYGNLILNGCDNGSTSTYFMYLGVNDVNKFIHSGNKEVLIDNNVTYTLNVQIKSGTTVNNVKLYPMLRKADIADDTYEPYHESVEEEIEQIYADNGVLGAKNLIPYPYYSSNLVTSHGVTFTVDQNGIIYANGTNDGTDTSDFVIVQDSSDKSIISGGILTGCPSGGSDNTYQIIYRVGDSTSHNYKRSYRDYGDGVIIPSLANNEDARILVQIRKNATVSNLQFKPMLRLASDPDDTYVPYAMTNRELTEELTAINNGLDDWTETKTVSSSGTVSFSGLNDSYSYSRPYYELPSGESAYTYSKVTKSGSGTSVTLTYTTDAPSGTVCKLRILK